jgi:hypothetical protein
VSCIDGHNTNKTRPQSEVWRAEKTPNNKHAKSQLRTFNRAIAGRYPTPTAIITATNPKGLTMCRTLPLAAEQASRGSGDGDVQWLAGGGDCPTLIVSHINSGNQSRKG